MASSSSGPVSLSALSAEERDALAQFRAVTDIADNARALGILRKYRFNVERAIHNVLDDNVDDVEDAEIEDDGGEEAPPEQPAEAAGKGKQPAGQAAAASNGGSEGPQQRNTGAGAAESGGDLVTGLVTLPFRLSYSIVFYILAFFTSLLPPGVASQFRLPRPSPLWPLSAASRSGPPRRRTDDPRAAAARFLLDFEQKYGRQHPEFFQGTYNQALDAAKRDLKYFLAVLQSEEHDDTEAFTRQVLCSERVCTFLRENNFVIWGGNIKESEAFQVSGILEATRYPFMAMIAPHSSQMRIFDRIEGPTTADALVDRLSRRIATLAPQLEGIRRQRREREEATRLREQQDRAYRESLRADEEKAKKAEQDRLEQERLEQERLRQEEEERERAEREERERQSKQRSKAEMRAAAQEKWASLAEPTGPGTTKLSVKLPSGARVVRRFEDGEKIETVYDFVLSQDLDPIPLESDFVLVGTYPRREFTDMAATLKDVGLVPNGAVLVEEAVPDE